jgi:N-methylhydantoinase B
LPSEGEIAVTVQTTFDPITLEVLWGGLISIVREISATLLRTAFSSLVRETNDYCVVLLDRQGRLVAPNDTAPSFLFTLPVTTQHALRKWSVEEWQPGDVVITNDPWLATGHVNDFTVITPIFRENILIGFVGSIAHTPDIGGRIWGASAFDVHEEGLMLPLLKLCTKGQDVEAIWEILRANVRVPGLMEGDLRAQILANQVGVRRVVEFLDENGVHDYNSLTTVIQGRSEQAVRETISSIPDGAWEYTIRADGLNGPTIIHVTVTVKGSEIFVDYTGSSSQQPQGVNSPLNYTIAYTVFPLQSVLFPDVPCNDGCFRPLHVTAPEGSVVNVLRPAAVGGRHITGHLLHGAVFGALAQVIPEQVMAVCPGCYDLILYGPHSRTGRFCTVTFIAGGRGARASYPGYSALSFPPNLANTPLEIMEQEAPIVFGEKSLRRGSGGAGLHRGGDGQRVVFQVVGESSIWLSTLTQRIQYPAAGLLDGSPGATGSILINSDRPVVPQGLNLLQPGDTVTVETPGGGGFGRPDTGAEGST